MDIDTPKVTTFEEFVSNCGLSFNKPWLLVRALTHRSYLNEHPEALEDNERLEFLGDAVLDFLVGAWLYKHFPEMREGQMTRLRSALVRTEQLADFATQIGLSEVMRLGRGEFQTGGQKRKALLCATFEALIGALYLDAGMSAVQQFVEPMLESAVNRVLSMQNDLDPKSMLQELVQSKGFPPPQYRTISATGPDHNKIFEVEVLVDGRVAGHGVGHSKQVAAVAAAKAALETLELF